ncbi:MAG: 16S rRNA (adenine(1518)-N(6)/adenine(1519)-N(6))-dimethyltransferase RsmA [Acidobacteriota bacterium]
MQQRTQRPKLGQNFLVSPTAQAAIADAVGNPAARTVVEIGPGRGAITALLAGRAQRLVAIELDRELAPRLREQFAGRTSVEVVEQDVLETDFSALRAGEGEKLLVVGNLPYYITSDILLRLFLYAAEIERAVVMVQREVADRIAASPGTRDYGVLTVTAQMYARVEKLMTLPPGAFSPPPQVYSTVLRLTMAPRLGELGIEPEGFLRFIRGCFAQKRKMLARNLRNAGFEAQHVTLAMERCCVKASARAEELGVETLARLWRELRPLNG